MSLHIAGGLLPPGLFDRVTANRELPRREPEDYELGSHETVGEAAQRGFDYLNGAWKAFTRARDKAVSQGRPLTSLTRERWLLPLFRALDYGILSATPAGGLVVEGRTFKVSHMWGHVPIHLLGWGVDLDSRTKGMTGAASAAPQSMVQELLNRTEQHLWAILSNGEKLRLLRDSRALAGPAYIEFDLELIFDQQIFSDFALLYRLAHASSFAVQPDDKPGTCRLEAWRTTAIEQGERALERLRYGVEQAINTLGTGFLRHPANGRLRKRLASGALAGNEYKRSVLRQVYRLLLWFVAEDRDVLLDPDAPVVARRRYARFFSARRLRERARRSGADHHADLWEAVRLVFTALSTERGEPGLALPGIGGIGERITRDERGNPIEPSLPDELDEPLEELQLANDILAAAVRQVAFVESDGQRHRVNFADLGSEELGGIYESLLELHALFEPAEQTFTLMSAAGNERKTRGIYTTPRPLIEALLDTALEPLLDEAARTTGDATAKAEALLKITVCDPACGSGQFLVAAARRIARRIAEIRSGEDEPSPIIVYTAMRQVVSRCLYGVDLNEMAAELAKVSLWLEPVEPAKPLAFLDSNIRVGNSLLGATPVLIERGIPKEAFKPIEGDDRKVAKAIERDSIAERSGQTTLFGGLELSNATFSMDIEEIVLTLPATLADIYEQRRRLRHVDENRSRAKRVADAWCSAFVQRKTPDTRLSTITESTLSWVANGPANQTQRQIAERVSRLTREYQFFHWHIEFPHIFAVPEDGQGVDPATGWRGGFTCIIGNPPWEHIELKEEEFFAPRRPAIARASNAAKRKKLIDQLESSTDEVDRDLHAEFALAKHRIDATRHFASASGRYPLTARGRVKTDPLFAELGRTILSKQGRIGMVLPTGIATDATTQYFFKDLLATRTLASLYDFENEEKLFPSVHNQFRFCLWTGTGTAARQDRFSLAFRLRQAKQIEDRRFTLTPGDIALLNPNTGTCPVFDYRRNADITLNIYRRAGSVLWNEQPDANPWGLSFMQGTFNMASDSSLFQEREPLEAEDWVLDGNIFLLGEHRMLPLYEAKMVRHFDHRFGTYDGATEAQLNKGTLPRSTPEQKADPHYTALPHYWVAEEQVDVRLARKGWGKGWLIGWRDICRSADERTMIPGVIPRSGVGHTWPLALTVAPDPTGLFANLCSFALDYVARQKMAGTHLTYGYVTQLPVLPQSSYDLACLWEAGRKLGDWIRYRVLELAYTTYDMEAFARDHGDEGAPFQWDEERRFWLRAELDAAYFHLYGVPRDDVDYVMDTFRAFRNNDPERFTRTKTAILDIYDAMAKAIETGEPYRTVLDPPPGEGPRHPARESHIGGR